MRHFSCWVPHFYLWGSVDIDLMQVYYSLVVTDVLTQLTFGGVRGANPVRNAGVVGSTPTAGFL